MPPRTSSLVQKAPGPRPRRFRGRYAAQTQAMRLRSSPQQRHGWTEAALPRGRQRRFELRGGPTDYERSFARPPPVWSSSGEATQALRPARHLLTTRLITLRPADLSVVLLRSARVGLRAPRNQPRRLAALMNKQMFAPHPTHAKLHFAPSLFRDITPADRLLRPARRSHGIASACLNGFPIAPTGCMAVPAQLHPVLGLEPLRQPCTAQSPQAAVVTLAPAQSDCACQAER